MKPWHEYSKQGVEDLARDALDAAALCIQERLGVETGDLAGLFFSGAIERDITKIFEQYIKAELRDAGLKVPM